MNWYKISYFVYANGCSERKYYLKAHSANDAVICLKSEDGQALRRNLTICCVEKPPEMEKRDSETVVFEGYRYE